MPSFKEKFANRIAVVQKDGTAVKVGGGSQVAKPVVMRQPVAATSSSSTSAVAPKKPASSASTKKTETAAEGNFKKQQTRSKSANTRQRQSNENSRSGHANVERSTRLSVGGGAGGDSYAKIHGKEEPTEGLAYSRQPRNIEYKPYTLDDYQRIRSDKYYELGSLGADLEKEELRDKRERLHMVKEFSTQLRQMNKQAIAETPIKITDPQPKEKSNREKALEFAARIPKPKAKRQESDDQEIEGDTQPRSELEILEERHAKAVADVNQIKRELGL